MTQNCKSYINYIFVSSILVMERRRSDNGPEPFTALLWPPPSDLSVSYQDRLGEVIVCNTVLSGSGFRNSLTARYAGYVNVMTIGVSSKNHPKASHPAE